MKPIPLRQAGPARPQWQAQRLYRPYVVASLAVALLPGFATGVALFLLPALGLRLGVWQVMLSQTHGVAQLFGWAGLFAMGLAYHVVPRFRNFRPTFPWPQYVALALVVTGILLRYAGQNFYSTSAGPGLLIVSGVALLAGTGTFSAMTLFALAHGNSPRTPGEPWLWAACVWALAAATLHLAVVVQMAVKQSYAAPVLWDGAFVHAALMGFLANEIFGISLRTLPAFMSLPPWRKRLAWIALPLFNIGVGWYVMAELFGGTLARTAPGQVLELVATLLLVLALRVFARRTKAPVYVTGIYVRYEWFVRAAYGWLLGGAALQGLNGVSSFWGGGVFPAYLSAPVLHVLTIGFLSMMLMGMASRMLPMFEGAQLPNQWLMDAAFVTLNASVVLRVGFGLLGTGAAQDGLAASGALGLLAVALFGVVVVGVLRPPARETYRKAMAERLAQRGQGAPLQVRPARGEERGKGG